MFSETILMTMLTHPLQVLLIGMILSRLARERVAQARRPGTGNHPAPVAGPSRLRAA